MDLNTAKNLFYFKFNYKDIILKILLFLPTPKIHVNYFQQTFHSTGSYLSFIIFELWLYSK